MLRRTVQMALLAFDRYGFVSEAREGGCYFQCPAIFLQPERCHRNYSPHLVASPKISLRTRLCNDMGITGQSCFHRVNPKATVNHDNLSPSNIQ